MTVSQAVRSEDSNSGGQQIEIKHIRIQEAGSRRSHSRWAARPIGSCYDVLGTLPSACSPRPQERADGQDVRNLHLESTRCAPVNCSTSSECHGRSVSDRTVDIGISPILWLRTAEEGNRLPRTTPPLSGAVETRAPAVFLRVLLNHDADPPLNPPPERLSFGEDASAVN